MRHCLHPKSPHVVSWGGWFGTFALERKGGYETQNPGDKDCVMDLSVGFDLRALTRLVPALQRLALFFSFDPASRIFLSAASMCS